MGFDIIKGRENIAKENAKVFDTSTPDVDALELMKKNNVTFITLPEIKSNIKEEWKIPTCKTDGYKPVVFFYKNGIIDLDFFNEEKCDYLSEYDELALEIEYPFIDGYKPTMMDWKMLGFDAHFE